MNVRNIIRHWRRSLHRGLIDDSFDGLRIFEKAKSVMVLTAGMPLLIVSLGGPTLGVPESVLRPLETVALAWGIGFGIFAVVAVFVSLSRYSARQLGRLKDVSSPPNLRHECAETKPNTPIHDESILAARLSQTAADHDQARLRIFSAHPELMAPKFCQCD